MRLAQPEIDAIVHAAKSNFGPSVHVILFGSRVDDSQRGGDIDVFVESREPIPDRLRKTLRMDADLQIALGEQKIDVVVFDPTMTGVPVHREARKKGVALAQARRLVGYSQSRGDTGLACEDVSDCLKVRKQGHNLFGSRLEIPLKFAEAVKYTKEFATAIIDNRNGEIHALIW